jgi:hypothetical protein
MFDGHEIEMEILRQRGRDTKGNIGFFGEKFGLNEGESFFSGGEDFF